MQDDLDEKSVLIESLNQKIELLESGRKTLSEENLDNVMSKHDNLLNEVTMLKVYQKFCNSFQQSFNVLIISNDDISSPSKS